MRKVWIVVANRTNSKIYRAENVNTLVEHKVFQHEEGHLTDRDLIADGQGRSTQRGFYGTDTMEEKTPTKVKESMAFASEIAAYLEEGCTSGECERIYLISKAPFLGFLRQSLSANVSKLVESEIQKDLSHMKPAQIREYLPPVL